MIHDGVHIHCSCTKMADYSRGLCLCVCMHVPVYVGTHVQVHVDREVDVGCFLLCLPHFIYRGRIAHPIQSSPVPASLTSQSALESLDQPGHHAHPF